MKSPEFLTEFNKVCEGLGVEGLDVPMQWGDDIKFATFQFSFTELQKMVQLLPKQYADLVSDAPKNPLILKLGASIVLSCKPAVFPMETYAMKVEQYSNLIDQCNAKFEQARKQAVETIYTREMLLAKR